MADLREWWAAQKTAPATAHEKRWDLDDRLAQLVATIGEHFTTIRQLLGELKRARVEPVENWPLAVAQLPTLANPNPPGMQGRASIPHDGILVLNPTASTIGIYLYLAGIAEEAPSRLALVLGPQSWQQVPIRMGGWRVDPALTISNTSGAPYGMLLTMQGPVSPASGTLGDTVQLTGSLPAGSAQLGTVGLTGNLVPLTVVGPTLLATLPYTDFTASAIQYVNFIGKLSRNARSRTITVINDLNVAFSSLAYRLYDSAATPVLPTGSQVNALFIPGAGTQSVDTSLNVPQLGAQADSIYLVIGIGSTAAASGDVYVYLTEEI